MMGVGADKLRGAYFTDPTVARFLVDWAIRSSSDRVLEPSAGMGSFLRTAVDRLGSFGAIVAEQLVGVEQDPETFAALAAQGDRFDLRIANFFDLEPDLLGKFNAVVGNPPFIRYQLFNGTERVLALTRAAQAGVKLTALTSAWAPFLVHATRFLSEGGRMAVVAPAELCHAVYARPVLRLLNRRFRRTRIISFESRLFPALSEDTVLVLAEGYDQGSGNIRLVSLANAEALETCDAEALEGTPLELHKGETARIVSYLLPEEIRRLYLRLTRLPRVIRLGEIGNVGIGYVTGNNSYFHLSGSEAGELAIPDSLLSRAICRGNWISGVAFTESDWKEIERSDAKARLLDLRKLGQRMPRAVERYITTGERRGVHRAYKCRVREPWYVVPHVSVPDLFLSYMSNDRPRLATNEARVVATNTLLCVDLMRGSKALKEALVIGWWTSLAALSAEIEGHSLGAGMLKLEPREAARVVVPLSEKLKDRTQSKPIRVELDQMLRQGRVEEALNLGDREVLQRGLGLSSSDCALLRRGFDFLASRRRSR